MDRFVNKGLFLVKANGKARCPVCRKKIVGHSVRVVLNTMTKYQFHIYCLRRLGELAEAQIETMGNNREERIYRKNL